MSKYRQAAKIDSNQPDIVKNLRTIPGMTVEVGHDDIIVGYQGRTYWYEIKEPSTVGKNGEVRELEIKPSQKKLLAEFTGHYKMVWSWSQILQDIGLIK